MLRDSKGADAIPLSEPTIHGQVIDLANPN